MKKKKTVCWVSADYLLDVDIPVLEHLAIHYCEEYQIFWFIVSNSNSGIDIRRVKEMEFLNSPKSVITLEVVPINKSLYDLRVIPDFSKLFSNIRLLDPDLVYFDIVGVPFFHFLSLAYVNPKKIVHAAHNVIDYEGWPRRRVMKIYLHFVFKVYKNFQFFSEYQRTYFLANYQHKNTFYAPLCLKDYGESNKVPHPEKIAILFFGNIKKNKRLDLLISAFKNLDYSVKKRFHITIAGKCDDEKLYLDLIANDREITFLPGRIADSAVADLFSSSHYVVLPYSNVAQSGPHMIAYNYHIPVIASDLPGFAEKIIPGVNGWLFEPNNMVDLCSVLKQIADTHSQRYNTIKSNLTEYVKTEYSVGQIVGSYVDFFNSIIDRTAKF